MIIAVVFVIKNKLYFVFCDFRKKLVMYQEQLIKAILSKIGSRDSLIAAISAALDISYDAAHRRISLKSRFTIEEAIQLAKYFGLSLDHLFEDSDVVAVKKTKEITSSQDLSLYLENSYAALKDYPQSPETTVFYSAKDIPLFYTIGSGLLSRFKLFVWLNILDFGGQGDAFESFQFQAPLLDISQKLQEFYHAVQVHEIWNDTTVYSTLQQVLYFFQAGFLKRETALLLYGEIEELFAQLELQCNAKNDNYKLYYHDLLILNNNVLVSDGKRRSLFVPYTMLGYFITTDKSTCTNTANFYQKQLNNSMLLNTAGTKDKKVFFNKIYQKIGFCSDQIKNIQLM